MDSISQPAEARCMFRSQRGRQPIMPIDHIVVLMMENNGFDRMLGWMASA
jgi:phospholipase C